MKYACKTRLAALLATFVCSAAYSSNAVPDFPSSQYQTDVPSTEQVLGYPLASRISEPAAIHRYFQQLAEHYPDRIQVRPYAQSWQGRPLFYVVISSANNISRISQIENNMQRLAAADMTAQQAQQIIEQTPGTVWIANTLHGNEISPAEASMALAYHLLADQSEHTRQLLADTVVYIDPLQNPDGHHRFVSRYYATVGLEHSADRLSAEQNEPWPKGRTNHYLFDMNRDWIALTQPENRGRVKALLQTYPLLYVDSHEMGGDMSYYFSPEADPYNPYITPQQRETLDWIGQNNAKWFDHFGYDYFTREIFDAFYPGYGASWPLYQGSVATTYEMGSARGHQFKKKNGDILTFADGVQRNFVAFMATIETVQKRHKLLLERFYQYRKNATEQGNKADIRSYILPATRDKQGHIKLTAILAEQGIKVQQATHSFKACGNTYQAGSYYINTAQPVYHLIRTLLDKHVPMDKDFLKEQERLRSHNLPDQIYDVTAWSLPLMYNLDIDSCNRAVQAEHIEVGTARIAATEVKHPAAAYGFVVPWDNMGAARFMAAALRQGVTVKSADLPFTHQNGKTYPAGTLIIGKAGQKPQLIDTLKQLAAETGADIEGIDSSWVTKGPGFGSDNVKQLIAPNIAMLWDEPTNELSAGSARYVIERELGYPVTAIRPAQLRAADLSHYQVLIMPATGRGSYQQALGKSGTDNIQQWVKRGGVLITLGNATRFAIDGDNPLLASNTEFKLAAENATAPLDNSKPAKGRLITSGQEHQQLIQASETSPDWVPGFLAKANVDQQHWLTAGMPATVNTVYTGSDIYQPLTIDYGRNVVSLAAADEVIASGFAWDETRKQIAYKPLLMVQGQGRGYVIAFTQEPNYRAYVDGMHLLLVNAIFKGAAQASPLR